MSKIKPREPGKARAIDADVAVVGQHEAAGHGQRSESFQQDQSVVDQPGEVQPAAGLDVVIITGATGGTGVSGGVNDLGGPSERVLPLHHDARVRLHLAGVAPEKSVVAHVPHRFPREDDDAFVGRSHRAQAGQSHGREGFHGFAAGVDFLDLVIAAKIKIAGFVDAHAAALDVLCEQRGRRAIGMNLEDGILCRAVAGVGETQINPASIQVARSA